MPVNLSFPPPLTPLKIWTQILTQFITFIMSPMNSLCKDIGADEYHCHNNKILVYNSTISTIVLILLLFHFTSFAFKKVTGSQKRVSRQKRLMQKKKDTIPPYGDGPARLVPSRKKKRRVAPFREARTESRPDRAPALPQVCPITYEDIEDESDGFKIGNVWFHNKSIEVFFNEQILQEKNEIKRNTAIANLNDALTTQLNYTPTLITERMIKNQAVNVDNLDFDFSNFNLGQKRRGASQRRAAPRHPK